MRAQSWVSALLPAALVFVVAILTCGVRALVVVPFSDDTIRPLVHQRAHLLQQHITDHGQSQADLIMSHHPLGILDATPTLVQAGLFLPIVPDEFFLLVAAVLGLVLYAELEPIVKKVRTRQSGIDLRIPYDAAARLSYEKSDKILSYEAFKAKFEADAIASVIAKRKNLTSTTQTQDKSSKREEIFGIVGRLALEARDKFVQKTQPTVAEIETTEVAARKSTSSGSAKKTKLDAEGAIARARALAGAITSDKRGRTIPNNAEVQLGNPSSDERLNYDEFKKYEATALSGAQAENVNVKISYNAAARLAFEAEGYAGSIDFLKFEELYVKRAIAKVTAKKKQRDAEAAVVKAQREAESAAVELQWLRDAEREASEADTALLSLLKTGK